VGQCGDALVRALPIADFRLALVLRDLIEQDGKQVIGNRQSAIRNGFYLSRSGFPTSGHGKGLGRKVSGGQTDL